MPCTLVFDIQELDYFNKTNSRQSLDNGEICSLGFLSNNGFWVDTCSGLAITFQDGSSVSFSNDEIRMIPKGGQKDCLEYLGKETDHYLGIDSTVGIIEPVLYMRYLYGILPPAMSDPAQ